MRHDINMVSVWNQMVVSCRMRNNLRVLDAGVSADGVVRIEFQREMTDGTKVRQAIERLGISVLKNLSTATEFSADGQSEHENNPATVQHADHDHGDAKDGHNREGAHDHHHGGIFGQRSELIFAIICGVLLLIGWLLSFSSINGWGPWTLYAGAYFFGGYYIVREAIEKILLRRFEIDFLMIVAAIGAAILGAWACLLYTSPSPRDATLSRMPSSA